MKLSVFRGKEFFYKSLSFFKGRTVCLFIG